MPERYLPDSYETGRRAGDHSAHRRRRKTGAGRVGLAGALTGAVGIAAVAVGIVVLRPGADDDPQSALAGQGATDGRGAAGEQGATAPMPETGPPLNFTTPEGYGYRIAAVRTGTDASPLGATQPPPNGMTYAYADYVITNTQRRPVLLDYPADLFMPRAQVPANALERCMPQPGIPSSLCTLPNHARVTARLDGSKPPIRDGAETTMPAGASYLVRVASDLPLKDGVSPDDLKLYVWNARYTSDLKGIELAVP
ncbi:hypothetical protein [Spirillospora albida]|uniref:hypothetical protein n=1 Tax=Spirillospora albida TaxID=58123 RepID=UPI00068FA71A|nr:hypothetical protein [Spirillospora albida]